MEKPQIVPAQSWYFIRNTLGIGMSLMGQAAVYSNNQSIKQMESVLPGLKEVVAKVEQLIKIAKEEDDNGSQAQAPTSEAGPKS